jgi:hypothetical protein
LHFLLAPPRRILALSEAATPAENEPNTNLRENFEMVGWNGPGGTGKWQETDLFNLIGIDPNTVSDLTWAMLESRKRKLVSKLHLHNPTADMPKGVTIADINSFISDIDDIRRPWVEKKIQEDGETKLVL